MHADPMQKALFLDRDGVINEEIDFLHRVEDLVYLPGIFELCEEFQKRNFLIFIITNQSGIARGLFSEEDFKILMNQIEGDFRDRGILITKTYHCPHLEEISGECECRKPRPGMILKAANEFDLDLKNSVLIGDSPRDIQAGMAAGLQKNFLLGCESIKQGVLSWNVLATKFGLD